MDKWVNKWTNGLLDKWIGGGGTSGDINGQMDGLGMCGWMSG